MYAIRSYYARDIRMLHAIQRGLASGQNYDQLCQRERIWGKRKLLVRNACRRINGGFLERLLGKAADIDLAIKGVITSYSIHYTKLYDDVGVQPALPAAESATGQTATAGLGHLL